MSDGIPVTYVPARNTVFLSFALAWAEVLEADDIFIGVNALDYRGYPDCRPEYIAAYEQMANLATKRGVEGHQLRIHTPLIELTKAEIIRRGLELGVDYALTRSCYDPIAGRRGVRAVRLLRTAAQGLRRERPSRPGPIPAGRRCMTSAAPATEARVKPQLSGHRDLRPDDPGRGRRGRPATHFVRLGGCDYRCSWCDTMYAVDPAAVRANARRLSSDRDR